jgi:hypothetical protein
LLLQVDAPEGYNDGSGGGAGYGYLLCSLTERQILATVAVGGATDGDGRGAGFEVGSKLSVSIDVIDLFTYPMSSYRFAAPRWVYHYSLLRLQQPDMCGYGAGNSVMSPTCMDGAGDQLLLTEHDTDCLGGGFSLTKEELYD